MSPIILLGEAAYTLPAQILTIMIGFAIVVWILTKFGWDPIVRTIDERRETIAKEFDTIDKKQAALESRMRDYEERLRQIDNEARERLNKAIDEGKKIASEIVEEARRQSDETKAKAAADIKLEIEKARVELRDDIVRLTLGATEKLLKAELNQERHRQLVGSFITELESRRRS